MKHWYYISSWQKAGGATWGDPGAQWQRVGSVGPIMLSRPEAGIWARTEMAKHSFKAYVQLWRWTGAFWIRERIPELGELSKVGQTGAGVSVGVSLGGLFWMGLAGVAGYYACKKRLI